jgi:hypothetical protein
MARIVGLPEALVKYASFVNRSPKGRQFDDPIQGNRIIEFDINSQTKDSTFDTRLLNGRPFRP